MASVTEFFKDQNVFITGGSGFLGKILVEKLLYSSPDIGKIYLMLRKKKNRDVNERLKELLNLPIYDNLKMKYPENLKKVIAISGDCYELGLGLSEDDRLALEENVSIVFHCAASIRFDDSLKNSVINNTRGTRELMMLSRKMKNLKILVHVSTSYCNCDKNVVEEKLYPPHADWRKLIEVAENTDDEILQILTPKIIGSLPNTYLFSKSLSEHVVKDLGENMPIAIVRPSIVTSSWKDPIPGWTDNFNGPTGLLIGGGKGVVRSAITKIKDNPVFDCIPADTVIKILCITAWLEANSGKKGEPSVYNATCPEVMKCSLKHIIETALIKVHSMPMRGAFWIPRVFVTDSMLLFKLHVIFLQVIPAIIVDYFLKLSGKQPLLAKIQRKIFITFEALNYFTMRSWTFKNDKMAWLNEKISESDDPFNIKEIYGIKIDDYFTDCFSSVFRFLTNEPNYDTKARREIQWMKITEKIVLAGTTFLVLWWVYHKAYLQRIVFGINDAFNNFDFLIAD